MGKQEAGRRRNRRKRRRTTPVGRPRLEARSEAESVKYRNKSATEPAITQTFTSVCRAIRQGS